MVQIVLGKEAEKKIAAISLANNTVQRRIADMSTDIKEQVVEEIRLALFGLISIQLDELTNFNLVLSLWFLSHISILES